MSARGIAPLDGETYQDWFNRFLAVVGSEAAEEVAGVHAAILRHLHSQFDVHLENEGGALRFRPVGQTSVMIRHPERGPVFVELKTAELAPIPGETIDGWYLRFERARTQKWDAENPELDELLGLLTAVGEYLGATYQIEPGPDGRFHQIGTRH